MKNHFFPMKKGPRAPVWAMDSNLDPVREPGGPVTRNSRFMGTQGSRNTSEYKKIYQKYIKTYWNIPKIPKQNVFQKKSTKNALKKTQKSPPRKRRDSAGALPQN